MTDMRLERVKTGRVNAKTGLGERPDMSFEMVPAAHTISELLSNEPGP